MGPERLECRKRQCLRYTLGEPVKRLFSWFSASISLFLSLFLCLYLCVSVPVSVFVPVSVSLYLSVTASP